MGVGITVGKETYDGKTKWVVKSYEEIAHIEGNQLSSIEEAVEDGDLPF